MILSFNTIAFSPFPIWANAYKLKDCAEIIANSGLNGIEIIAGRPHAYPQDLSPARRKEIRKTMRTLGLRITAICPLISPSHNPASTANQEIRAARRYLKQCVELAADLECCNVIYPAGWVIHGGDYSEAWKRSLESLHLAAEEGASSGTTLLIEAVRKYSSNLLWTSHQAIQMMNQVGHPSVKLMMDTYHVWSENEDIAEVICRYGDDLLHVHLVDISETGRERRIPGQGVHDMEEVVSLLKTSGFTGALSVEIWGDDPENMALESGRYLKKLIG